MHNRFLELERLLEEIAPNQIAEAQNLAATVVDPAQADADQIWEVIWNKPLFANMRVDTAIKKYSSLQPLMKNAWQTIGKPNSDFLITQIVRGIAIKNFEIEGARAEKARAHRVAPHRLFAIQGGANALRARVQAFGTNPYRDLVETPLRKAISKVMGEMGAYWGPITTLHFHTDLGLACKPDLHLVRAVQALCTMHDFDADKVPNLDQCIEICEVVRQLAICLYGASTPARIRYLDKVLMEISRQGLIGTKDQAKKPMNRLATSSCRTLGRSP